MSPTPPRTAPVVTDADWTRPRPIDECYWVVPGRLLVGAYPGSRSRAQAMERLRRFLEAGVTCFIDLTEAMETPGYEQLLPFETPAGRRVEYLREPIVDHGIPSSREVMTRQWEGALTAMRNTAPSLVIFDLNNTRINPLGIVAAMKEDAALASIPTLGYASHVQTEVINAARHAGVGEVLARSAFATQLGDILKR